MMEILKMMNNLFKNKNVTNQKKQPVHIVEAVEKMDKTIARVEFRKNVRLFQTDYLE